MSENIQNIDVHDPFEGMSDEEIAELLEVFFEDISEKTENLTTLIIELEENPANKTTINSLFQIYHSLKGTIGTFGFYSISKIVHKLEFLIEDLRENRLSVSPDLIDLLLNTLDIFKKIVIRIKSQRSTQAEEKEMLEHVESFSRKKTAAKEPDTITKQSQKEIIDRLKEEAEEYIKLRSSKIDKIISLSSDLILRKRFDSLQSRKLREMLRFIQQSKSAVEKSGAMLQSSVLSQSSGETDQTVENYTFSSACNELENMLINLLQDIDVWHDNSAKLLDNLQHEVLQARMVEINDYFQQLKRSIRDLVRKENKKVKVKLSGLNTEIDRNIMEGLKDPVMHIIRNAIDHGIESPEERSLLGKDSEATIRIAAYPSGNEIKLEIEDDGRGIDLLTIKRKAVEKGLYTEEEIENLSEQEIINIIFYPGFSTSEVVTQVSGRGVGMDVVKSNIEKINGVISVDTRPGEGTKFLFKIPITLSAFPALLVKSGEFYFYIQIIAVERIFRIPPEEKRPAGNIDEIEFDGVSLPLAYLGEYFNVSDEIPKKTGAFILIIRSGENRIAVEVDECIDRHDIVLQSVPDILENIDSVSGVSILPDGNIAYVLEPSGLISGRKEGQTSKENPVRWSLNTLAGEIQKDIEQSAGQVLYSEGEDSNKQILLQFRYGKKIYGIPVKDVDLVCDLYNENLLDHLNDIYDSVLTVKDEGINLIKRNELKNPLKWDSWKLKGAAVVVKSKDEKSILIPDSLGTVDLKDISGSEKVKKLGKWKALIPDVVFIEELSEV